MDSSIEVDYNMVYIAVIVKERGCMPGIYTPMAYLVFLTSVSVNHPGGLDTRRGRPERAFMTVLRSILPPARENQKAADFLWGNIGTTHPFVQWVVVPPDTLLDGDVSEYTLHEGCKQSLRRSIRSS
jgi:hypothetical protein